MFAEAITNAEAYGAQSGAVDAVRRLCADLQQAYAKAGRPGVVTCMLRQASEHPHVRSPMQLALLFAEAGDMDAAFDHLGRAIDSRDPCLANLAVAPQWDSLRGDPRFAEVLGKMGLNVSKTADR